MTFTRHCIHPLYYACLLAFGSLPGYGEETIELEAREVFGEKRALVLAGSDDKAATYKEISRLAVHDLSDLVANYPGYSAYRRTSARAAHPTTQGVRIRNLGANATSRALVTLDGIPLNDPFGAWIYWHRLNPQSLRALSINTSGSSEAWGNFGSGGSITFVSKNQRESGGEWLLGLGSDNTYQASLSHFQSLDDQIALDFSARLYETDGFHTVESSQRGSIDQKAGSSASSARARLRWGLDTPWNLTFVADYFSEERNNGTPLAANETDAFDTSIQFTREFEGQNRYWNLSLYKQTRDFSNVFTSVRDNRTWERPALDQFDVPADALGAGFNYYAGDGENYLLAGVDYREAEAQVHELFRNLGNGFERQRSAGGQQSFAGIFAKGGRRINETDTVEITFRVDRATQEEGFRKEFDIATDNVRRDETFARRSGTDISGSAAYYRDFSEKTRGGFKVFSGFRAPTLNELYRPFRVGNDITETNPELANERQSGAEISFQSELGNGTRLSGSLFHYEARDMIANALLSTEPGFDPLCGFIPAGGSCSQRIGLEKSEVSGAEFSYSQDLSDSVSTSIQYVYTDSRIRQSTVNSALAGNRFAHASPHRLNARIDYRNDSGFALWARASLWDKEYEDLENLRRIDSATLIDLGIRFETDANSRITLQIENVFDTVVETGISTGGLLRIGAPRSATLSFNRLY